MKAYEIHDKDWDYCLMVFAENRGKAISYALGTDSFPYSDYVFTDLRAKRRPKLDKYYHGNKKLDWWNNEDRFAWVKEYQPYCEEYYIAPAACESCPAKEICETYKNEGKPTEVVPEFLMD